MQASRPEGPGVRVAVPAPTGVVDPGPRAPGVVPPPVPPVPVVGVPVPAAAHARVVMTLLSIVTAPLRARVRPSTAAPVVSVIDVRARIVPLNVELVPSVAE